MTGVTALDPTALDPTALDPTAPATVETGALVGNPRRTRGLDAAQLRRPAPTSAMVGNPRRTRRLNPAQFAAA